MVKGVGFKSYTSVDKALNKIFSRLSVIGYEFVSVYNCVGRVLAEDVIAEFDIPQFDRAAMDGYAVKAEDTFGASQTNPIILKVVGSVEIGENPEIEIKEGEAVKIATGAAMPRGSNAVVMLEYVNVLNNEIEVLKPVTPYKNVSKRGEDVKKGEVILKRGEILQPQDAAILASLGYENVKVYKKPIIAVISTGNELVEVGKELEFGKIYNSNTPMICNALAENGFKYVNLGIARDLKEEIEKKLIKALEYDVVVFIGGTSVGERDLVPEVIEKHGEIVFHGVSMKPGMPVGFAIVNDKPVFMLPGFPVATYLSFYTFVIPALYRMMNVRIVARKWSRVRGILQARIASEIGVRSFVRVYWENGKIYPVRISGSGIISSLIKANALLIVPEEKEGFEEGEEVEVVLIRDLTEVFE